MSNNFYKVLVLLLSLTVSLTAVDSIVISMPSYKKVVDRQTILTVSHLRSALSFAAACCEVKTAAADFTNTRRTEFKEFPLVNLRRLALGSLAVHLEVQNTETLILRTLNKKGEQVDKRELSLNETEFAKVAFNVMSNLGLKRKNQAKVKGEFPLSWAQSKERLNWGFMKRLMEIQQVAVKVEAALFSQAELPLKGLVELATLSALHGAYYSRNNEIQAYKYWGNALLWHELTLSSQDNKDKLKQWSEDLLVLVKRFGLGQPHLKPYTPAVSPCLPERQALSHHESQRHVAIKSADDINNLYEMLISIDSMKYMKNTSKARERFTRNSATLDAALLLAYSTSGSNKSVQTISFSGGSSISRVKNTFEIEALQKLVSASSLRDFVNDLNIIQKTPFKFLGDLGSNKIYLKSADPTGKRGTMLYALTKAAGNVSQKMGQSPSFLKHSERDLWGEYQDRIYAYANASSEMYKRLGRERSYSLIVRVRARLGNYTTNFGSTYKTIDRLRSWQVSNWSKMYAFLNDNYNDTHHLASSLMGVLPKGLQEQIRLGEESPAVHKQIAAVWDRELSNPHWIRRDQYSKFNSRHSISTDDYTIRNQNMHLLNTGSYYISSGTYQSRVTTQWMRDFKTATRRAKELYEKGKITAAAVIVARLASTFGKSESYLSTYINYMTLAGRQDELFLKRLEIENSSFSLDNIIGDILKNSLQPLPDQFKKQYKESNTNSARDYLNRMEIAFRLKDYKVMAQVAKDFHYSSTQYVEFYRALGAYQQQRTLLKGNPKIAPLLSKVWERFTNAFISRLQEDIFTDYYDFQLKGLNDVFKDESRWPALRDRMNFSERAYISYVTKRVSSKLTAAEVTEMVVKVNAILVQLEKSKKVKFEIMRDVHFVLGELAGHQLVHSQQILKDPAKRNKALKGIYQIIKNAESMRQRYDKKIYSKENMRWLRAALQYGGLTPFLVSICIDLAKTHKSFENYAKLNLVTRNPTTLRVFLKAVHENGKLSEYYQYNLNGPDWGQLFFAAYLIGEDQLALRYAAENLSENKEDNLFAYYFVKNGKARLWIERNAPSITLKKKWLNALDNKTTGIEQIIDLRNKRKPIPELPQLHHIFSSPLP
jgi:AraC-like DNA-binding protein